MDIINAFVDVFNSIKSFILDCIDILFYIPKFITNFIEILPSEIQAIFITVLVLICMALLYRFIK